MLAENIINLTKLLLIFTVFGVFVQTFPKFDTQPEYIQNNQSEYSIEQIRMAEEHLEDVKDGSRFALYMILVFTAFLIYSAQFCNESRQIREDGSKNDYHEARDVCVIVAIVFCIFIIPCILSLSSEYFNCPDTVIIEYLKQINE